MQRSAAFLVALCFPAFAWAADCTPTPSVATKHYPGAKNIPNGNDLLKPAGKAVSASGQRVVIHGRVLDHGCVPVQGATIELWQVDPFGKLMLATGEDLVRPGASFSGAGRTYTDSDGNFWFITAFPAAAEKRAPHVDVKIAVEDEKDFSTALYFAADSRNATDPIYSKVTNKQAITMQVDEGAQGLTAKATIVLPYKASYRTY